MPLLDDVKAVCQRLAPAGWKELLLLHGLDVTKADLAKELTHELPTIDRSVPGFEDFAAEGVRGIEPGQPSQSLLFHALASPNVLRVGGKALRKFPTLREIETVENYVFATRKASLAQITGLANGKPIAIVVFASEYRSGADTVHRRHADLCFSRTGVARVGTEKAQYDPAARGFTPIAEGKDQVFRVLPASYSVWITAQEKGDPEAFGPMRPVESDKDRLFWLPLHKLFDGGECLQGFDLKVALVAHHVNEKIRRIHLELLRRGADGGWRRPDIDSPPFRFIEGIAEIADDPDVSSGLLAPVPHATLVEPAQFRGEPLTFVVPQENAIHSRNAFLPTFEITAHRELRLAPEYVHVRTAPQEPVVDLNDLPDSVARVRKGNYRAQHYIDFTGDGWIAADCPQLRPQVPRFIPAYSIVAAPDFFFNADQRQLMEWWSQKAPKALRAFLWETPPNALSDERMAPNLKLNNVDFHAGDPAFPSADFREEDDTVTAIVSLPSGGPVMQRPLPNPERNRHNALPDGASGVFAPGWDTSRSATENVVHLAAYGLGSPFPEDSKLCAALSTFWPSVAPDAGRSFSRVFPTVSPLTDDEIGSTGNLPWDGVAGPRVVQVSGNDVVEYADFDHVDYVRSALKNRFSLKLTSRIGTEEYVARVLAMARAYRAVGVRPGTDGKATWNVLSFRRAPVADVDRVAGENATDKKLEGEVFRFELYKPKAFSPQPADFRKRHVGMKDRRIILVGGSPFVLVQQAGKWQVVNV